MVRQSAMKTLLEEVKKGNCPPVIKFVAKKEGIPETRLKTLVARGEVVILQNPQGDPVGIGRCLSTKVNANIGTSPEHISLEEEIEKARMAEQSGADTLMDLSTGGDLDRVRRAILESTLLPVGSVPIYQAALRYSSPADMTSDDMFNSVRLHAKDGISFVTIHAGVNLASLDQLKSSSRILGIVSRGGAFMAAWMAQNQEENPFYREFDYLLEMAGEYDLTLSLGDGMRPGCIQDASDRPKFTEFISLGRLVRKARKAGVQTMVEGPGHVPLDEIALSVQAMKHLCDNAPVYLLGPLVTDLAPGYDHITAAIGGALAGMHGADYLCVTTPTEHLSLPTPQDVREGVMAARIAAHAADLVRPGQRERARSRDREMAEARAKLDWEAQFQCAIDPEKARSLHRQGRTETCTMCGELCTIKLAKPK